MAQSKVASFLEQHKELLQIVNTISGYLKKDIIADRVSDIVRLLAKLEHTLKLHLTIEDKGLYPIMLKSDDQEVKSTAQKFIDEMGGIADIFGQYREKWDSEFKINEDTEGFISETNSLFESLNYRIAREEKTLYPLFDKTIKSIDKKTRFKWLTYGLFIGFGLLVSGIVLLLLTTDTLLNFDIFNAHPLLWVISFAPIMLGFTFFFAGTNIEKHEKEKVALTKKNKDMSESWLRQTEMLNMELTMATGQIQAYATQLETISDNIATPICLIDKAYKIEQGFNSAFSIVFGKKDFFNIPILDTVFGEQSADMKTEIVEFLELAFNNSSASDDMINAANPVLEWHYLFNEEGAITEKAITTKIVRVIGQDNNTEKLMFIFEDVTFKKMLQAEKAKEKEEFESELELITIIFKNEKDIIVPFINEFNTRLEDVKILIDELKQDEKNVTSVNLLIRHIHTIKGETFSIGFKKIASLSKDFESYIKEILQKEISLEENLTLMDYLEKLKVLANELNDISKKLFNFSEDTNKLSQDSIQISTEHFALFKNHFNHIVGDFKENQLNLGELLEFQNNMSRLDWQDLAILQKQLSLINEKTSLDQNKQTELNFIYDLDLFPLDKYSILKETLMHLIRNSIAHGIETPEERLELKKVEVGKINVHLYQEERNYVVMYSDDGAGLNVEKIKANALKKKLVSAEAIAKMENKEILALIFEDGLSTAEKTDDVSGVGAGMSIVKSNVSDLLKGKLALTNNKGNGIRIKMVFPI